MAIHDKTQTQCSKLQGKTDLYIKSPLQKKIQSNYYPTIASVDSSTIESTCIFPKILNKHINAYVENTSKQK